MRRSSYTFIFIILISLSSFAQNWTASKAGSKGDLISVYFTSANTGWVTGDDGFLAKTNNGGKTWNQKKIETQDSINEIYFRDEDNGYLVAGRKMFKTTDGGRSWKEFRPLSNYNNLNGTPDFLSVRFTGKKDGFIIGSLFKIVNGKEAITDGVVIKTTKEVITDSLVLKTTDGGDTWSRVIIPYKKEIIHLDFANDDYGWMVGDGGSIFATTDGGKTWELQKSGTDQTLYNVDFRDRFEGYAVGRKGTILRTDNGGKTWEKVKVNFPETFLRVDFADDKNGWIVGYKGTILHSADRGKTWTKQESQTNVNLYGLYITKKYGFAVGETGTIVSIQK